MADRLTFVLVARVPKAGVDRFQAYEDAVLPLLTEFGGLLERRLRTPDGTVEIHIVSFDTEQNFQRFRSDARELQWRNFCSNQQRRMN